jgi:hypothetical protein
VCVLLKATPIIPEANFESHDVITI